MQPRTADEFLDLACLTHTENDAVERREQAEAILAASPGLAQEDAYVAAALGDVSALREHLDCDANLATRRGGPRDWDALLYVCNARLAAREFWDPLACARLLLDRGADPRTHTLMYQVRYTAITGAIGIGEAGPVAARHTRRRARSSSFCSMRVPIQTTSRRFTTCTSCATTAGLNCCSRGDFGNRRDLTICWAPR